MNSKLVPDTAIKLLMVEASPNKAEALATAMRNAGMAVHTTRVAKEDDLLEALKANRLDLALYSTDTPNLNLDRALVLFKTSPGLPLIVLTPEPDSKARIRVMREGGRDLLAKDDLPHLQLVVKRELETLMLRRRLGSAEQRLKEAEDRNTVLMQTSRQSIAYIHEGMHVRANPAYLETFGYVDMDDIEGMPLLDMIAASHHKALKDTLRNLEKTRPTKPEHLQVVCQTTDGSRFEADLEFSPATIDGEPCTQVIISDQQFKKELEHKLRQLTTLDVLTGLSNRQFFLDSLEELVPRLRSNEEARALFYINVDNFHEMRNAGGFALADTLLKEIAGIVQTQIGGNDLLARFGDHSFTLLAKDPQRSRITAMAEVLCREIESHDYKSAESFVSPTCSIGVSLSSGTDKFAAQDFIGQAYQACEAAAKKGGNQYCFFDTILSKDKGAGAGGDAANLEELIRFAIKNERFRLVYQPIVSLQGDTRENYAVMVRMLDRNNEEVTPTLFIPQAEKIGEMAKIDRWVIRHAAMEMAEQRKEGKKIFFFVSVSGDSMEDESLLLYICDLIEEFKLKGAWFTFQIAERDIRSRIQQAKRFVEELKKIGCMFAIDQFGLLAKPETFLKHFPVNYVRLDRSFMDGLTKNQKKQDDMRRVHNLAHSFDIQTVATGVEDANSLAVLWNVGVNFIQGYFLQEPSETIAYDFSHG